MNPSPGLHLNNKRSEQVFEAVRAYWILRPEIEITTKAGTTLRSKPGEPLRLGALDKG